MKRAGRGQGEAKTGERIRAVALALFRERGFDETTMRDVAREAGMSLGAAYYYFPSKDAIVLSYYDQQQEEHARLARVAFEKTTDVAARVRAAFHTKLQASRGDRALLGALMHTLGDRESPVSLFAAETAGQRARSLAIFTEALAPAGLPEETARTLALALWTAHLGALLYFLHDRSPGQRRTKRLVDDALALVLPLLPLLALAPIDQAMKQAREVLRRAGLDVTAAAGARARGRAGRAGPRRPAAR